MINPPTKRKPRGMTAGLVYPDEAAALSAAEQACGDLAIDIDQRAEALRLRVAHHSHGMVHDEQADIDEILPKLARHRMIDVGHIAHEHRPELAIVEQRIVELGFDTARNLAVPVFLHGLQTRGRLKQQRRLELTRA